MEYKIDTELILDSFIKYVKIDTGSKEDVKSVPSSKGQLELGRLIKDDFNKIGVKDCIQDSKGYVIARIKGDSKLKSIGFLAHLDTSPEYKSSEINPIIHENYDGKDIELPKNSTVIKVADYPVLRDKKGLTIISSDGETLLGADDKAGIAICMELAKFLVNNKDFKTGDVVFIFTPDEEVGHSAKFLDIDELSLACAYTLDGEGLGRLCRETFCANSMKIRFYGSNVHPGEAKGRMINAIRVASSFIEKTPIDERPETTDGEKGFFHPFKVSGAVDSVDMDFIIRDFQKEALEDRTKRMKELAESISAEYGVKADIVIRERYMNIKYKLKEDPRVLDYARKAIELSGVKPVLVSARGATDGASLSYKGLLAPDISAGMYAVHSREEWACLEDMAKTSEILRNLLKIWAKDLS